MVIFLEASKNRSKTEQLGEGIGKFVQGFGGKIIQNQEEEKKRNEFTFQEQIKHENAKDLLNLKGDIAKAKKSFDIEKDAESIDSVRDQWGERAANLFAAASEGGKTSLMNTFLELTQRGQNVEEVLKKQSLGEEHPGLTSKENVARESERYRINEPKFEDLNKKIETHLNELTSLDLLNELSPGITGWQKLNVNPLSGELIIPALATPEMQRYVKTINDFTTKAKDSYGARVTNFDLQQFMKRLPTLANSPEGRADIIEQMKLLSNINLAREMAINDYVDEKGGVRYIDWDRAVREGEKRAKPIIDDLKKDLKRIEIRSEKMMKGSINADKKIAKQNNKILMENEDGEIVFIDKHNVGKAKEKGFKIL